MSKSDSTGISTLTKFLLGMVFLATLGFFYMSARALKTWEVHRSNVVAHKEELSRVDEQIQKIKDGLDQEQASIRDLQTRLSIALINRGRVFSNVQPKTRDPKSGAVGVRVDVPNPPKIEPKDVLYVFEEPPAGTVGIGTARYLGEFEVTGAGPPDPGNANLPNVTIQPTTKISPAALQRIANSQLPWVMYEVMPRDGQNVLAGKTDEEIRALIPLPPNQPPAIPGAKSLAEIAEAEVQDYLRDGKPAQDTDAPERVNVKVKFTKDFTELQQGQVATVGELKVPKELVVKDKEATFDKVTADRLVQLEIAEPLERTYRRSLRDYSLLFRELNRQIPMLQDRVAALTKDLEYYDGVRGQNKPGVVQQMEQYLAERELVKADLDKEKQRLANEVNTIKEYLDEVSADVKLYADWNTVLLKQVQENAAKWAAAQRQEAQRIERAAGFRAAAK